MAIADDEHMSQCQLEDDGDSLFGEGDDVDCLDLERELELELDLELGLEDDNASLFGDGDGACDGAVVSSHFMDDTCSPPPNCVAAQALPSLPQSMMLTLPTRPPTTLAAPPPPPALSLPLLPLLPQPQQSSPSLTESPHLPTPPCEGARSPGPQDVSTHSSQTADDSTAAAGDDALDIELRLALELELFLNGSQDDQDHPINSPPMIESAPTGDAHVCRGLKQKKSYLPAAESAVNVGPHVPRRLDQPGQDLKILLPCIAKGFTGSIDRLYKQLGLDEIAGKALMADAKLFLSKPERVARIETTDACITNGRHIDGSKSALIRLSLEFLRDQDKGQQYFGNGEDGCQQRTTVWPDDSSRLICYLAVLFRRCVQNARYNARIRDGRYTRSRKAPKAPGKPDEPTPIPKDGSTALKRKPGEASRSKRPSKVRKATSQEPPAVTSEVVATATELLRRAALPAAQDLFTKVPANASLKYVIYVMRLASKTAPSPAMVIPPITLSHSDEMSTGAYWHVLGRCRDMGLLGVMEVFTTCGFEIVNSEMEWDEAVRKVYDEQIMDRVVKVRLQPFC